MAFVRVIINDEPLVVEGRQVEIFGLAVADSYIPGSEHTVVVGSVFQVDNQLCSVFTQEMVQDRDVGVLTTANR